MLKTPIVLVLVLLVLWLLVRSSRHEKVPPWARAIQVILVVGLVLGGLYFCKFRIERAKADIERSRGTARMLMQTVEQYESDKGLLTAVATPFGASGVVDAAEFILDLANRGEISTLKQAANDARYCLAEVDRDLNIIELVMFSQPAACRAMFQTLGEPGALEDAGVTFEDAAQRATAKQPPGAPGGPACREWEITQVEVTLPKTKKSGKPWDVGDVPPDPYVAIKLGAGKRTKSPRVKDRHELRWTPKKTITTTPGTKMEVQVYDADFIDDDFAFGWEAEVPTNVSRSWSVGRHPNTVEFSMKCRR